MSLGPCHAGRRQPIEPRRPPGGVSADPPFVLIDGWGSLYDPSGRTTTGTGHSAGTLTFVMAGDTVAYDGFREAAPRREVELLTVPGLEDFDPRIDDLEIYDELLQFDVNSALYGPAILVLDRDTSAIASADGLGSGLRNLNASVHQSHFIAATAGVGGTNNLGLETAARYTFGWARTGSGLWTPTATARTNQGGADPNESIGAPPQIGTAMDDPGSQSWWLSAAVMHGGTTSATPTIIRRVWARKLRRGGLFPS